MQLLRISVKSILSEKKKSISLLVAIAIATIISLLFVSINLSFGVKTAEELRNFSPILIIYTQESSSALSTWVSVGNIMAIVIASMVIAGSIFLATFDMRKEFKNYSLMGASFSQVAIIVSVKNTILFLAGFFAGVVLATILAVVIGALTSTAMIFNVGNIFVCLGIEIVLTAIISIVVPLWN